MNREFYKPIVIVVLAAILVGVLAMILPEWDNTIFPIKKMKWFEHLRYASKDSTLVETQNAEAIAHNNSPLSPFMKSLSAMAVLEGKEPLIPSDSEKQQRNRSYMRIAYFGDSIIEGDLITAPLRTELQSRYGGIGVGMMPITSIVSGFRQTIRHSFSKNWETLSFMTSGKSDISLGITGYTFIPRNYYVQPKTIEKTEIDTLATIDTMATEPVETEKTAPPRFYVNYDPWVEYKAVNIAGGASVFKRIRLFYSNASASSTVKVSYDNAEFETRSLSAGEDLQMLELSQNRDVKSIKLVFKASDPIHVYGVSFDDERGIYVDNFPIRGYSGSYFQRIRKDILKDFDRFLGYDLIVLQYGENVSSAKNTDYNHYKQSMIRTIKHIQSAVPKVPILVVSAHDRSIKIGTEYMTSPDIPILVKAQSELAIETKTAFWNLYEAMGGYNSMLSFVRKSPAWAGKDYTHFTRSGAEHVSKLFISFLKGEK